MNTDTLRSVYEQTYNLIDDIYFKYFQQGGTTRDLTKEQTYTLQTTLDHIKYNLILLKKYKGDEVRRDLIRIFNERYNENGLEMKESE